MAEYIHATIPLCDIDAGALEMFMAFANDAANCNGNPLVEPRIVAGREESQRLIQLKRAGLLATVTAGGRQIIHFTGAGRCLAHDYGVEIPY